MSEAAKIEQLKKIVHDLKADIDVLNMMLAAAYKDPNMVQKGAMVSLLQNICGQTFSLSEAGRLIDKLVKVGWPE